MSGSPHDLIPNSILKGKSVGEQVARTGSNGIDTTDNEDTSDGESELSDMRPRVASVLKTCRSYHHDDNKVKKKTSFEEMKWVRIAMSSVTAAKKRRDRRLVIIRSYIRVKDGDSLKRVELRVLVDTGSQEEFISPRMAAKLGISIKTGLFGLAVTAFGDSCQLTRRAEDVELTIEGANPLSLLASSFTTKKWNFIEKELGDSYDMIIGTKFLREYGADVLLSKNVVRFTTNALGAVIEAKIEADEESEGATDQEVINQIGVEGEDHNKEFNEKMSELARTQYPDMIMTPDELEELGKQHKELRIYAIKLRMREGEVSMVNAVGRVTQDLVSTTISEEEKKRAELPEPDGTRARNEVEKLVKEFPSVFTDELPAIDPSTPLKSNEGIKIVLKEDAQPTGRYGPRLTYEENEEAAKMIKELTAKGFIRPSRSPWGAPMFLVAKPDGTKRMVIDYRALNTLTVRNRYPLPRSDVLFDKLGKAQYFSKIDLRTGYWQIRMEEESIPLTAFTSSFGHYEWTVLPMGLTNAPAEFMNMMQNVFRNEIEKKFVLAFLDDILIYSNTYEEHLAHIRAVLMRLREMKLHAKLSKCSFFKQEVQFLGHYVGRGFTRMIDGKVDAVKNWPIPTTQKDVEQFVGFINFYRRFVQDLSRIAAPLTKLCGSSRRKDANGTRLPPKVKFIWTDEQQESFDKLKELIAKAPCLAIADPKREFIIHTDASGYATGAVLMQKYDQGLRPVAFLSKKMLPAEINYPVHEQELLAILHAMKAWRHYLSGKKFKILTDHQSLQYIKSSKMATGRQQRWAAEFSEFEFEIGYAPGATNVVADALSRSAAGGPPDMEDQTEGDKDSDDTGTGPLLINAILELPPIPVRVREVAREDADYQKLLKLSDEELEKMNRVKSDGLLYVKGDDTEYLVIPKNEKLRHWCLSYAHDAQVSAHRSSAKMIEWLRNRLWWPTLSVDASRYAETCPECQRNKPDNRGRQGMPMSLETPLFAFDTVGIDFIGPLPVTPRGNRYIMTVVDKLTRYVLYIPMPPASAQGVFEILDRYVLGVFGTPSKIISDRDTRFTSLWWEGLWKHMRGELKRSTAFHPQTDGSAERENRTVIEALRAFVGGDQVNWDILLPSLQRAHNSSVNASTGASPDMLLFGRELTSEFDNQLNLENGNDRRVHPGATELHQLREAAIKRARLVIEKQQERQRNNSMKGRRPADIKVGDSVWLNSKNLSDNSEGEARKLKAISRGPFKVLEMKGSNAAVLELPNGTRFHPTINLDLLKKHIDDDGEFPDRPIRDPISQPIVEDPSKGGPLSVEEGEYEVQSIRDKRTRHGKTQYKVRWKGYRASEDSWQDEEDCINSSKLIAEYEEKLLAKMNARVSNVQLQIEKQKLRVSAIKSKKIHIPRHDNPMNREQAELKRKAAVDATFNNYPIDENRDKPDAHGKIVMDTQRCAASTKKGDQCRQLTRFGCYCFNHRRFLTGLRISKSNIPGAGLGLFATREFKKDAIITHYTGDLLDKDDLDGDVEGSTYVFEASSNLIIDAARTNTADGRLMNDSKLKSKANCRFSADHRGKRVIMKAIKNIKACEELLVWYGNNYWDKDGKFKLNSKMDNDEHDNSVKKRIQPGESRDTPIILDSISMVDYNIDTIRVAMISASLSLSSSSSSPSSSSGPGSGGGDRKKYEELVNMRETVKECFRLEREAEEKVSSILVIFT